jgi:hypothetical protein
LFRANLFYFSKKYPGINIKEDAMKKQFEEQFEKEIEK